MTGDNDDKNSDDSNKDKEVLLSTYTENESCELKAFQLRGNLADTSFSYLWREMQNLGWKYNINTQKYTTSFGFTFQSSKDAMEVLDSFSLPTLSFRGEDETLLSKRSTSLMFQKVKQDSYRGADNCDGYSYYYDSKKLDEDTIWKLKEARKDLLKVIFDKYKAEKEQEKTRKNHERKLKKKKRTEKEGTMDSSAKSNDGSSQLFEADDSSNAFSDSSRRGCGTRGTSNLKKNTQYISATSNEPGTEQYFAKSTKSSSKTNATPRRSKRKRSEVEISIPVKNSKENNDDNEEMEKLIWPNPQTCVELLQTRVKVELEEKLGYLDNDCESTMSQSTNDNHSTSQSSEHLCKVGDKVMARFRGRGKFYPGTIEALNRKDGVCTVQYDDGDIDEGLKLCHIKLPPSKPGDQSLVTIREEGEENSTKRPQQQQKKKSKKKNRPFLLSKKDFAKLTSEWKFLLSTHHSLLVYGFGSKKILLNQFSSSSTINQHGDVLVLDGYDSDIRIEDILNVMVQSLLNGTEPVLTSSLSTAFASPIIRRAVAISQTLGRFHPRPVYIILHNIDGMALRNRIAQDALAALVSNSSIHQEDTDGFIGSQSTTNDAKNDSTHGENVSRIVRLVASVDNVDAMELLWGVDHLSNFSWVWKNINTYCPYFDEVKHSIIDETRKLKEERQEEMDLEFMQKTLSSLAPRHMEVLKILVELQLEKGNNNNNTHNTVKARKRDRPAKDSISNIGANGKGILSSSSLDSVPYNEWKKMCLSRMVVTKESELVAVMTELTDHRMMLSGKDDGNDIIVCVPTKRSKLPELLNLIKK